MDRLARKLGNNQSRTPEVCIYPEKLTATEMMSLQQYTVKETMVPIMVHSIWEMAESNQAVFLLTEFATQTFHLFNRGLNPGQETCTLPLSYRPGRPFP